MYTKIGRHPVHPRNTTLRLGMSAGQGEPIEDMATARTGRSGRRDSSGGVPENDELKASGSVAPRTALEVCDVEAKGKTSRGRQSESSGPVKGSSGSDIFAKVVARTAWELCGGEGNPTSIGTPEGDCEVDSPEILRENHIARRDSTQRLLLFDDEPPDAQADELSGTCVNELSPSGKAAGTSGTCQPSLEANKSGSLSSKDSSSHGPKATSSGESNPAEKDLQDKDPAEGMQQTQDIGSMVQQTQGGRIPESATASWNRKVSIQAEGIGYEASAALRSARGTRSTRISRMHTPGGIVPGSRHGLWKLKHIQGVTAEEKRQLSQTGEGVTRKRLKSSSSGADQKLQLVSDSKKRVPESMETGGSKMQAATLGEVFTRTAPGGGVQEGSGRECAGVLPSMLNPPQGIKAPSHAAGTGEEVQHQPHVSAAVRTSNEEKVKTPVIPLVGKAEGRKPGRLLKLKPGIINKGKRLLSAWKKRGLWYSPPAPAWRNPSAVKKKKRSSIALKVRQENGAGLQLPQGCAKAMGGPRPAAGDGGSRLPHLETGEGQREALLEEQLPKQLRLCTPAEESANADSSQDRAAQLQAEVSCSIHIESTRKVSRKEAMVFPSDAKEEEGETLNQEQAPKKLDKTPVARKRCFSEAGKEGEQGWTPDGHVEDCDEGKNLIWSPLCKQAQRPALSGAYGYLAVDENDDLDNVSRLPEVECQKEAVGWGGAGVTEDVATEAHKPSLVRGATRERSSARVGTGVISARRDQGLEASKDEDSLLMKGSDAHPPLGMKPRGVHAEDHLGGMLPPKDSGKVSLELDFFGIKSKDDWAQTHPRDAMMTVLNSICFAQHTKIRRMQGYPGVDHLLPTKMKEKLQTFFLRSLVVIETHRKPVLTKPPEAAYAVEALTEASGNFDREILELRNFTALLLDSREKEILFERMGLGRGSRVSERVNAEKGKREQKRQGQMEADAELRKKAEKFQKNMAECYAIIHAQVNRQVTLVKKSDELIAEADKCVRMLAASGASNVKLEHQS